MADEPKRSRSTWLLVIVALIILAGWLLLNFGGARTS